MAEVAAPEGTTLLSGSGHLVTPTVARTASSRRRSRQHQQLCADDPLRRCLKCPNSSCKLCLQKGKPVPGNSRMLACCCKWMRLPGAGRTDEETASALNLSVRTIERVRER